MIDWLRDERELFGGHAAVSYSSYLLFYLTENTGFT